MESQFYSHGVSIFDEVGEKLLGCNVSFLSELIKIVIYFLLSNVLSDVNATLLKKFMYAIIPGLLLYLE
jgi:hypothetical protein